MRRVFTTRYRRQMESKLRSRDRQEEKKRQAKSGERFSKPVPPLIVRFQNDTGKMPAGFPIQLPSNTAIAAIHHGRSVALLVGSFNAVPDLVVDDDNLEHARLDFAVL